jgi:hypothetical protein
MTLVIPFSHYVPCYYPYTVFFIASLKVLPLHDKIFYFPCSIWENTKMDLSEIRYYDVKRFNINTNQDIGISEGYSLTLTWIKSFQVNILEYHIPAFSEINLFP